MEAAGFVERAKGKVVAMGVVSCVANAVGSVVAEFPAGGTDGGDFVAFVFGGVWDVGFAEFV